MKRCGYAVRLPKSPAICITKRRSVLQIACAMAIVPGALLGQTRRRHRVGFISGGEGESAPRYLRAFNDGMRAHGYAEGRDFELAVRYYGSQRGKIPALVDELIAWPADVIVASISSTAAVVKKRTTTVPIVMVTGIDAVAEGLVETLAKPGGNLTGMTGFGPMQYAKLVEAAHELLPRARRIAFVTNPGSPMAKISAESAAEAAKARGLDMAILALRSASEVERFAAELLAARADALVVATDGVLFFLREPIVRAAFKAGLPVVALLPEFIQAGAVATLGHDLTANYRAAARYVDRILKGTRPAELPVEQPTEFELVLNLKSAKALGIAVPPPLMVRASRVVE